MSIVFKIPFTRSQVMIGWVPSVSDLRGEPRLPYRGPRFHRGKSEGILTTSVAVLPDWIIAIHTFKDAKEARPQGTLGDMLSKRFGKSKREIEDYLEENEYAIQRMLEDPDYNPF